MAEENEDGQEKTEDPTDDRRNEFRQRGEVAMSREFTSVFVLAASVALLTAIVPQMFFQIKDILTTFFLALENPHLNEDTFIAVMSSGWLSFLKIVIPIFLLTLVCATGATFFQTRLNFSWKRLEPKFERLNILSGIKRLFSSQASMELAKGMAKMMAVGLISYLILRSEWLKVPALLNLTIVETWGYWGDITKLLFWSVAACLLVVAGGDYAYNRMTLERK